MPPQQLLFKPDGASDLGKNNRLVTILVVESDAAVREFAATILHDHGYEVIVESSGLAGLETFRKHESGITLIVTGIVMPEITGVEMVRQVLTIAPSIKVVFMMGYSDSSLSEIDPREFAILQKPFAAEALLKAVHDCLSSNVAIRHIWRSVQHP